MRIYKQIPYDDLSPIAFAEVALDARAEGFEVIERGPDELLLDLDSVEATQRCNAMIPYLDKYYTVKGVEQWASKGGNFHVRIKLGIPVGEADAILLQAICGSDPIRELLSRHRMLNGIDKPTRLFKPPTTEEDCNAD